MSARRFANIRIYRNLQRARENNVIVRNATEREMDEQFPHLEKVAYEATGGTFPFSDRLFGDIWRQFHTDPRFIMRSAYVVDPWSGKRPGYRYGTHDNKWENCQFLEISNTTGI